MSNLEQFKIDLKALPEDDTVLSYRLDDAYFEAVEAQAVRRGDVSCTLNIHNGEGYFDLDFHLDGLVFIPCDLCLDDMEQAVLVDRRMVAKFGDDPSEDDDLLTVPESEGILDVSWLIYEFIELSIPLRHVHAPGKCNPAMMKVLEEHSAARSSDEDGGQMDSRWETLKNIDIKD